MAAIDLRVTFTKLLKKPHSRFNSIIHGSLNHKRKHISLLFTRNCISVTVRLWVWVWAKLGWLALFNYLNTTQQCHFVAVPTSHLKCSSTVRRLQNSGPIKIWVLLNVIVGCLLTKELWQEPQTNENHIHMKQRVQVLLSLVFANQFVVQ